MSQIYGAQAKRKLDPLLQLVSWGEEVVITKDDRPINRLTAQVSSTKKKRRFARVGGRFGGAVILTGLSMSLRWTWTVVSQRKCFPKRMLLDPHRFLWSARWGGPLSH
jgi:antitoxin (DNA-binding transcriptional repressor) of toxin-antitoxin stability system